jgi:hypothetical protein
VVKAIAKCGNSGLVLQALEDERIDLAEYFLKDGSGVLGHAAI